MFYTIIPTAPPTFTVQPDQAHLSDSAAAELVRALEKHFMSPVALVSWDAAGQFRTHGAPVSEELATDEDLVWREFELPGEPEVPF
mgnify:FL=1